jgi:hypothetical protein
MFAAEAVVRQTRMAHQAQHGQVHLAHFLRKRRGRAT